MADHLTPVQNLNEFREIQKFAAACRRLWPGAKIVLRPDTQFVLQHEPSPEGDPANQMTDEGLSDE